MHLDCLPDRTPGPCSISSTVRGSWGLGFTIPVVGVLLEGDSWEAGRWGNFVVFLFLKFSEARAPLKHSLLILYIIQGTFL